VYSDGEFWPNELAKRLAKTEVTIAALIDHDTFAAVLTFLDAAKREGSGGIAATEIDLSDPKVLRKRFRKSTRTSVCKDRIGTQGATEAKTENLRFCRDCGRVRPRCMSLRKRPRPLNTLDRDSWIAVLPEKTVGFGRHFPKSTHVSAEAVALGGSPLKKRTWMAGEEVEYAAGGRTGPQAPSGKGAGVADKAHHPGTPPAKSSRGVESL